MLQCKKYIFPLKKLSKDKQLKFIISKIILIYSELQLLTVLHTTSHPCIQNKLMLGYKTARAKNYFYLKSDYHSNS